MKTYENLDISDLEGEVWKVIEDFPDYFVSNLCRIKSFIKWHGINCRILKQIKNSHDYLCVHLSKSKKSYTKDIHVLIFETFNNCKLKDNECIHHINENKNNNNLENLLKMTKKEHLSFHNLGEKNARFGHHECLSESHKNKISKSNSGKILSNKHRSNLSKTRKEKFKNGELIILKGENSPNHKLTEEQVIQIKFFLKEGKLTQQEIADMFGVSNQTISKIKNNKTWKNIIL